MLPGGRGQVRRSQAARWLRAATCGLLKGASSFHRSEQGAAMSRPRRTQLALVGRERLCVGTSPRGMGLCRSKGRCFSY